MDLGQLFTEQGALVGITVVLIGAVGFLFKAYNAQVNARIDDGKTHSKDMLAAIQVLDRVQRSLGGGDV